MVRNLLWLSLCGLLAIACGVALSLRPWQLYREQRLRSNEAVHQMRKAESDKVALLRQESRFASPAGKEELARSRGYSRPGEVQLEINR